MTADGSDIVRDLSAQELEPTLDLLGRLIEEPSVEGSAAIEQCLDLIDESLESIGGVSRRFEHDGLSSLTRTWGGDRDGSRRLLLCGHTDVVPAGEGWRTPAFHLSKRDGQLVGRGVCDMKGALAAFAGALKVLAGLDRLQAAPISLVVTGDEEVGSRRGMIPLLGDGEVAGQWAICGEPTGLAVFLGNRGLVWLTLEIRGRGGHSGLGHEADNPVHVAGDVIGALHRLSLDVHDERFDPPVPSLTVTWMKVEGEPVINVIPDAVSLGVDRRLLPGESPADAIAQIEVAVREIVRPPYEVSFDVLGVWPPYVVDASEPLVRAALAAVHATGRPAGLGTDPATDDSTWLGQAGITTILLGPGEPAQAHTSNEELPLADLRDAIEIYARLALTVQDGAVLPPAVR